MITFDFLGFWDQWINQFLMPVFTYIPKAILTYDPLLTVQEYLVYINNVSGEMVDKLSYIAWLQEQQNYLLNRLIFVAWLILLFVFISFTLNFIKTLVYMVRDSFKI